MASSKTTGSSKTSRHRKDKPLCLQKNFRLAAWPISGRLSQKKDFLVKSQILVASLRLKNEIGERQDSLRRMGRACPGMLLASTQTGTNHLALTFLTSGCTFYEVSS